MRENLPPPHWSPTGNSGTWYWDDKGSTVAANESGCWKWTDDEQLVAPPPMDKSKKKNWLERIKNKILKG